MRFLQALTLASIAQRASCILYWNTTTDLRPSKSTRPSLPAISVDNRLSVTLAGNNATSQDATESAGQQSSATAKASRLVTAANASASITISANLSTITEAPTFPCGRSFTHETGFGGVSWCLNCPQANGTWAQELPENTCSTCMTERLESGSWSSVTKPLWVFTSECYVYPGTVSLFYWPTHRPNETYASTTYHEALNVTFTSPSVYYVLNTIYASNACGLLGPTASNAVFAYDLTDVTTWSPTATPGISAGFGPLQLNDLAENCPTTEPTKEEASAYMMNDVNRCNPRLQWPLNFKRFGYPYWGHCGAYGNKFGVYDPPIALTQAVAAVVPTLPSQPSPKTDAPATGASATANLPSPTNGRIEAEKSTTATIKQDGEAAPSRPSAIPVAMEEEDTDSPLTAPATPTQPSSSAGVADIIAKVISAAKAVTSSSVDAWANPFESPSDQSPEGSPAKDQDLPVQGLTPNDPVLSDDATIPLADPSFTGTDNDRLTFIADASKPILAGSSATAAVDKGVPSDVIIIPFATKAITAVPTEGGFLLEEASSTTVLVPGEAFSLLGHNVAVDSHLSFVVDDTTEVFNTAPSPTPAAQAIVTVEGQMFTAAPQNGAIVMKHADATLTLRPGASTTVAGQMVGALSGSLLIGTKITALTSDPVATPIATITDSTDRSYTVLLSNHAVLLQDASSTLTMHAGQSTTFAGQEIKAGSDAVVIGASTIPLPATEAPSPVSATLVDDLGQNWTVAPVGSKFVVEGPSTTITLTHGETTSIAGKTLVAQGSVLIAGTSTVPFSTELPSSDTEVASTLPIAGATRGVNSTTAISAQAEDQGNNGNVANSAERTSSSWLLLLLSLILYGSALAAATSM